MKWWYNFGIIFETNKKGGDRINNFAYIFDGLVIFLYFNSYDDNQK